MNWTKGDFVSWGQQPFQLLGTNDDHSILAANGNTLWPFALRRSLESVAWAHAMSFHGFHEC
jgi:hypothetical protein